MSKIRVRMDDQTQDLELVEELGYQHSVGCYVAIAKLPDGSEAAFVCSHKRGVYRKHRPIIMPRGRVTGQ